MVVGTSLLVPLLDVGNAHCRKRTKVAVGFEFKIRASLPGWRNYAWRCLPPVIGSKLDYQQAVLNKPQQESLNKRSSCLPRGNVVRWSR